MSLPGGVRQDRTATHRVVFFCPSSGRSKGGNVRFLPQTTQAEEYKGVSDKRKRFSFTHSSKTVSQIQRTSTMQFSATFMAFLLVGLSTARVVHVRAVVRSLPARAEAAAPIESAMLPAEPDLDVPAKLSPNAALKGPFRV
ncbi:hypothetical protein HMN09_00794500 [Mycena chlorophos]|uniref:Uncharacterized protein n=1 Tax=Mycena chlorophos TaxID=658473 RepID=A0A8H6STY3_MYCCL|nr:hypothetical protein HMN09_00794500 [Mycena chlorophos]